MERGRNLQNNILVIDSEQQYLKTNADCKGTLYHIFSNFLCFLLPTKMYAKRVECRYSNHNEKFSLHAKMSVITLLSFSMNKVSSR